MASAILASLRRRRASPMLVASKAATSSEEAELGAGFGLLGAGAHKRRRQSAPLEPALPPPPCEVRSQTPVALDAPPARSGRRWLARTGRQESQSSRPPPLLTAIAAASRLPPLPPQALTATPAFDADVEADDEVWADAWDGGNWGLENQPPNVQPAAVDSQELFEGAARRGLAGAGC